jgi:hypothetical protein
LISASLTSTVISFCVVVDVLDHARRQQDVLPEGP